MADPALEAERIALLAEQRALEHADERLRQTPDDHAAHIALLRRLNTHTARVRAFKDALQTRSVASRRESVSN
jgi:hypothetical protein